MTVNEKINITNKRAPVVMLAPLDWGLGHATRCIPLITHLLSIGCEVIVAAEDKQEMLLKQEFTEVRFVCLRGYRLKYSKNNWLNLIKIISQIPKILIAIKSENKWLRNFLIKNQVDAVISDNRYGFYNKKIDSVFITHQLTIKSPFGSITENFLRKLNYRFINNFNECWVPDYEGNDNLAGKLSHPLKLPFTSVSYLGSLGRMRNEYSIPNTSELLIILSGPEPQRSIFESILLEQLAVYPINAVMVRGLPGEHKLLQHTNSLLKAYNHLPASDLNRVINNSKIIISRSGYSTIMDLMGMKKKCVFIPTPGQPEQEYLAKYLSSKRLCVSFPQKNFSLSAALEAVSALKWQRFEKPAVDAYKKVLDNFVQRLKLL